MDAKILKLVVWSQVPIGYLLGQALNWLVFLQICKKWEAEMQKQIYWQNTLFKVKSVIKTQILLKH